MPYVAPLKDMLFVMNELAGLSEVVSYPSYAEAGVDVDLAPAILEESAKFNQDVVAPLNWPSDQHPSSLKDGVVTTTPGFKDAFEQFGAAGWQGVVHPQSLAVRACLNSLPPPALRWCIQLACHLLYAQC